MSNYTFTQDWFSWAPEVWEKLIPLLSGEAGKRRFLEIGSFEGRSAVWTMENLMADGDCLYCVDTWEGGEEHGSENMGTVRDRFDRNIILAREKHRDRDCESITATSYDALAWFAGEPQTSSRLRGLTFDFIYIDGSHIAKDVLTDACMAWPLLNKGGIMVFDDYLWGDSRDILHRPKIAIDAFTNIFAEEMQHVHAGYQMIVRKKP